MKKFLLSLLSAFIFVSVSSVNLAQARSVKNWLFIQGCGVESGKQWGREVGQNFTHGQGEVASLVELRPGDLYDVVIRSTKFTNSLDRYEFSATVTSRRTGKVQTLDLAYPNPEVMGGALVINNFRGGQMVCTDILEREGISDTFTIGAFINLIQEN